MNPPRYAITITAAVISTATIISILMMIYIVPIMLYLRGMM